MDLNDKAIEKIIVDSFKGADKSAVFSDYTASIWAKYYIRKLKESKTFEIVDENQRNGGKMNWNKEEVREIIRTSFNNAIACKNSSGSSDGLAIGDEYMQQLIDEKALGKKKKGLKFTLLNLPPDYDEDRLIGDGEAMSYKDIFLVMEKYHEKVKELENAN